MPILSKKHRRIGFSIFIVLASILILIWGAYQTWLSHIHVVIPNQVYRSAQLSPSVLRHYIKSRGIKSIINLRGPEYRANWYLRELTVAQQMDVQHYDLALSSKKLPNPEELRKLVYLLLHAPKPVLVHCLGGADRSGLASAIALILDKNANLHQSEQQISFYHLVFSPNSIGKLVFPYYQLWLSKNDLPATRENFLRWVCSPTPFQGIAPPLHIEMELYYYNPCPSLKLSAFPTS